MRGWWLVVAVLLAGCADEGPLPARPEESPPTTVQADPSLGDFWNYEAVRDADMVGFAHVIIEGDGELPWGDGVDGYVRSTDTGLHGEGGHERITEWLEAGTLARLEVQREASGQIGHVVEQFTYQEPCTVLRYPPTGSWSATCHGTKRSDGVEEPFTTTTHYEAAPATLTVGNATYETTKITVTGDRTATLWYSAEVCGLVQWLEDGITFRLREHQCAKA